MTVGVVCAVQVVAYVSELSPHLSDLMRRRRSGVVAALAAAAARGGPGPHQQTLIAALSNALGQQPQWQGRTGGLAHGYEAVLIIALLCWPVPPASCLDWIWSS